MRIRLNEGRKMGDCTVNAFFFAVFSLSYINYPRVHLNVFVAVCMSVNESDFVGRASVVSDELVPLPSGPVEDLNCSCNNNRR